MSRAAQAEVLGIVTSVFAKCKEELPSWFAEFKVDFDGSLVGKNKRCGRNISRRDEPCMMGGGYPPNPCPHRALYYNILCEEKQDLMPVLALYDIIYIDNAEKVRKVSYARTHYRKSLYMHWNDCNIRWVE